MKTAHVEIRSQHAKGSFPHSGPDTYVMVQVVPDGACPLKVLNHKVAALQGIELIYCGEGYSNRCKTIKSMLGAAIQDAETIAAEINEGVDTDE